MHSTELGCFGTSPTAESFQLPCICFQLIFLIAIDSHIFKAESPSGFHLQAATPKMLSRLPSCFPQCNSSVHVYDKRKLIRCTDDFMFVSLTTNTIILVYCMIQLGFSTGPLHNPGMDPTAFWCFIVFIKDLCVLCIMSSFFPWSSLMTSLIVSYRLNIQVSLSNGTSFAPNIYEGWNTDHLLLTSQVLVTYAASLPPFRLSLYPRFPILTFSGYHSTVASRRLWTICDPHYLFQKLLRYHKIIVLSV